MKTNGDSHHKSVLESIFFGVSGPLGAWWRDDVISTIEHRNVIEKIESESDFTPRYVFMTLMSAGIAVLGLLLSSPAVVIGAMLISPLMGPIIGLGFGLALGDIDEIRTTLKSLAVGIIAAVLFTALIVMLSPIQDITPEIAARTRPNLFDLMVAFFSALAGAYAMIRGREGTVVGVAIATALMPPLAVIGFGLATLNWPVFFGSCMLFFTNLLTIALTAFIMARLYGFGRRLSTRQSSTQAIFVAIIFVALAVPLSYSLIQIATESNTQRLAREKIADQFDARAKIDQVEIDFDAQPVTIKSIILTPDYRKNASKKAEKALEQALKTDFTIELEQFRVGTDTGDADAAQLAAALAREKASEDRAVTSEIAQKMALISGANPQDVLIDRDRRRAEARAKPLPGAPMALYFALENRLVPLEPEWDLRVVPPAIALPRIAFDGDAPNASGTRDLNLAIWAGKRLGLPIRVTGIAPQRDFVLTKLRENGIVANIAPSNSGARTPINAQNTRLNGVDLTWEIGQ